MLEKDVKLYPYRVFLKSGHVHQCWVPFSNARDFWDMKCDLEKKDNSTLEGCYFASNGTIIMLFIDAKEVDSMDTPFDQSDSRVIETHVQGLRAARTKHMKKKQQNSRAKLPSAGQTVKKRKS
ncbi:MAG: hypothetical protein ACYTBJ_25490 [Planctomycetota bacterium]|jgi:hypothetical protein